MSWAIGFDETHKRDIGYGVPAVCDHPDCNEVIDRGIDYVCGEEIYGGEHGCGLHFCAKHHTNSHRTCDQCAAGKPHFPVKPDHPSWILWKMTDDSWEGWRKLNPAFVNAVHFALSGVDSIAAMQQRVINMEEQLAVCVAQTAAWAAHAGKVEKALADHPASDIGAGHFYLRNTEYVQVHKDAKGAVILYHAKGWPNNKEPK